MFNASAISAGFNPGWVSVLAGGIFSAYFFFKSRNGEEEEEEEEGRILAPSVSVPALCSA